MAFDKIEKLPPRKYKKRTEQQKLIDTNDDLFRNIIYKRDNKTCRLAGKTSTRCRNAVQCAHIITRSNFRLRWDTKNAVCLCEAHHCYYTFRPHYWWEIVQKEWPELWAYVELTKRQRGSKKIADLQLMKIYLKQILAGME